MPIVATINKKDVRLQPTNEWKILGQKIKKKQDFKVLVSTFFITVIEVK